MSSPRTALAYIALYAAIGAHAPYLVVLYRSLGLDLVGIGTTVSVAALAGLSAAPAWGWLSDRNRGSARVFILAAITAGLGSLLLALAGPDLPVVLGASALSVGMAGMSPILDARALERSGADRVGYGPLRAWGSASYIVSSFATGVAIETVGIGALFVILAASIGVTAIVGGRLASLATQLHDEDEGGFRLLLGRRRFTSFLAAGFVTWTSLAAVMSFYPLRLGELGAGTSIVGLSAGIGALVEVPLMLRFPSLVARFGSARLLTVGAALFACRALLAATADQPLILVGASAVGGVGYALFLVGATTHISLLAPRRLAATAQGAFQGIGVGLGQVVASAAGGAIAQAVGLADLYLLCTGVAILAVLLVAVAVRERRPAGA